MATPLRSPPFVLILRRCEHRRAWPHSAPTLKPLRNVSPPQVQLGYEALNTPYSFTVLTSEVADTVMSVLPRACLQAVGGALAEQRSTLLTSAATRRTA